MTFCSFIEIKYKNLRCKNFDYRKMMHILLKHQRFPIESVFLSPIDYSSKCSTILISSLTTNIESKTKLVNELQCKECMYGQGQGE